MGTFATSATWIRRLKILEVPDFIGAPGRIRTCDLQLRRLSRKLDGSTRVDTFWRSKTGRYGEKLTLACAIESRPRCRNGAVRILEREKRIHDSLKGSTGPLVSGVETRRERHARNALSLMPCPLCQKPTAIASQRNDEKGPLAAFNEPAASVRVRASPKSGNRAAIQAPTVWPRRMQR